jgi:C-terminal processing protease CtpA/Prc
VGYIRLVSMDDAAVREIATWMPIVRNTRGLIVDVRGNGGGTRDALRALFPYFMSDSDAPVVVNAAKYRLHPAYGDDHLGGSRYMFRETWDGWTAAERAAIAAFRTTFVPEWVPPAGEFSDWHYLVMSRRMNPAAFTYANPVIVLLDEHSFSATDIFVSALKGWRNVTLMGTPSGGGSARQVPVTLPVSRIVLSLASMASFQRDGRLFDGHGTQPDVIVLPAPEYFLSNGTDVVLDAAVERLKRPAR